MNDFILCLMILKYYQMHQAYLVTFYLFMLGQELPNIDVKTT